MARATRAEDNAQKARAQAIKLKVRLGNKTIANKRREDIHNKIHNENNKLVFSVII